MGFWVCQCKACKHLIKDRNGKWFKHHKHKQRSHVYKTIIKRLRQHKHEEELPRWLFSTGSYTD